ncbi:heparinase II/III family protein [Francisella salimarina]|uniref:heparinase II/III domain-containing protein n=1 Tax=Francisella salimarina TaxID=2599927 RepID=UPI00375303BE
MLSDIKNLGELSQHIVKKYIKFGNGKNTIDFNKLKKAYDGVVVANRFQDQQILLDIFDWQNSHDDRNWWWQMQALPFLVWYVNSYNLMNDDEKKTLLFFTKKALLRWVECSEVEGISSPLIWHDHASAFRLRNIVKWINFLIINDLYVELLTDAEQLKIINVIGRHLNFLEEENNYSQYTNHGFDQMMIVYEVSLLWQRQNILQEIGDIAESRLEDELDHAFTEEGVHVENSPHYQRFMLSRAKQLIAFKDIGDQKLCQKATLVIDKATDFLRVITMPNGYLPMIGDTVEDDKGLLEPLDSSIKFYDYSQSGYYVAKGRAKNGKALHLVFKCSYISNYHRHDDDLAFHLYYDDQVIFGDGGLGIYQEQDSRRKFLRSPAAHNTIYPRDMEAIREPGKLLSKSVINVLEPGLIVATTSMYGGELQRVLDIRNLEDLEIFIKDKWLELPNANPIISVTNFFIPEVISANKITEKELIFEMADKLVNIKMLAEKANMYKDETMISKSFAQFDKATKLGWQVFLQQGDEVKTVINILNDPGNTDNNSLKYDSNISKTKELLNCFDLKGIATMLKREVCIENNSIVLRTEKFSGVKYAFYLYCGDQVEKQFYTADNKKTFEAQLCETKMYKAVFYYSDINDERCSYEIDFQIIGDNKINIVKSK